MFKMEYIAFTLIVLCSFGMNECGNMSEQTSGEPAQITDKTTLSSTQSKGERSSREHVHITDAKTLSSTQSNEEQSSREREQITDATTFPSTQNKGRTSIDIFLQVYIQGPNFLTPGVNADLVCTPGNTSSAIQFTWSGINCKYISGNGRTCTLTPSIENEGRNVTCMASNNDMTSATANYTILLAYGPFSANISGPTFINKTQLEKELLLSCSTDDVYPSATYSWTVRGTSSLTTSRCSSGRTCSLTPLKQNDGTTVTCIATNERDISIMAVYTYKISVAYGPLSASISGPTFINERQLEKELRLSCFTDDVYPSATYSWTVSSTSSLTTSRCSSGRTCSLTPLKQNDGTTVTCIATNERDLSLKAVYSYNINVAYGPDNVFISGPEYIDKGRLGKELSLTCSTDGVYPNVTYSWSRSDEQKQWNNIYGDTYRFSPHQSNDGVIVTCNATNTRDTSKSAKREYKLKVAYGPLNISIIGPPFINKTHLGKAVILYCSADDVFPNVSFSWSWRYNWHRACSRGNTCTFVPQKSDDGNTVTCVVTNTRDTSKRMTTEYKINVVYGPFKARITGPNFIDKSQLGKNIALYCNVDDVYPSATYSWTVSGTASSLKYWYSSDSKCNLIPTLDDDGKNVTCTATNERDVTIRAVDTYPIRIAYGPYSVSILGSPSINKSQLGKDVTLNCVFDEVFPNVSYKWFWKYDKHPMSYTCNTSSTCTFVPQIQDDGKIVTCAVTNTRRPSNWRSRDYTINVVYGPSNVVIFGPPVINETVVGKGMTLNCSAVDVYPNATFSWAWSHKGRFKTYLGNLYTFTPKEHDDGKWVTCKVNNARDSTKSATATYSLTIAYITGGNIWGPDYIVTNGSKTEKLVCNVTSVFPGANFMWDVPCNEQVTSSNNSICSVTPKISDDSKKITCNATNTRFSNLTTSASYIMHLKYPPVSHPLINNYTSDHVLQEGSKLTLTCSVSGGQPPVSSVNFFCGNYITSKSTSNKTTMSSTIVMDSLKLTENGAVCKCSALWEPEPGYYPAMAMVTLKVVNSTGTANYLLIGATVGASIIVILAIIIALVIVIKKNKVSQTQSTNTSRQGKGRSLSDCVDHINELYGTWDKSPMTLTGTDMLNHQNTSILPPADIYAQVNKSTRHDTSRDDRSLLESEQPIYAQAQKIKPVVKIKPEIMSKHDAALDNLHQS